MKRKLSFYLPEYMLREMQEQADRLERPLSWLIHRAWRIAHRELQLERQAREAARDAGNAVEALEGDAAARAR